MKKLIEIAKKAAAKPYNVFRTVVDGFSLSVFYDTNRGWFECWVGYSPSWGHRNYIYGKTEEQLADAVKAQIAEDKKIYKDGGRYPENYYG